MKTERKAARLLSQISLLAVLLSSNSWAGEKTVDLILVVGQSNAVGFDTKASDLPPDPNDKKVMFWWRCGDMPVDDHDSSSNQEWTTLKAQPKGNPKKGSKQYGNFRYAEGGFGPEIGFARHLMEKQPDRSLAIIKVAYSASPILFWTPHEALESRRKTSRAKGYPALISETKLAIKKAKEQGITLRPRALVWVQGVNDCRSTPAETYKYGLNALVEALRKELKAPELIALMGFNSGVKEIPPPGSKPESGAAKIVRAMADLADASTSFAFVSDHGCGKVKGTPHFSSEGTLELGKRFAKALLKTEEETKRSK